MNDWQIVVLEELKSINRKLEKLDDDMDSKIRYLEHDIQKELGPIKKHVTQVKFTSVLLITIIPLIIGGYSLFI